jgi:hypothetical protein
MVGARMAEFPSLGGVPSMARSLPVQFVKARADWWRAYKIWIAIHWTLSAFAVIFAALAAAITNHAAIFGIIAATSSSLIGLGNPYQRANAFMRACRRLGKVCLAYECDDSVPLASLLKVHEEGEQIIEASENYDHAA